MIEIEGNIVSTELLTERFCCDLAACRGMCCVEGNAGAPVSPDEVAVLTREYPVYRQYMKPAGVKAIERDGFAVLDEDGDLTTTLVAGAECAYSYEDKGMTLCAIERAFLDGRTTFRKPVSCHLYPIRLTVFGSGAVGLGYHRWEVCRGAEGRGELIYKALREPIVRRFGQGFFDALAKAERYIKEQV
ncbi:MAG: DUF3109 family protein [Rikenellaceae bacterium]|nr:DUF3109 family protein [Rikenellaceae bacterium]